MCARGKSACDDKQCDGVPAASRAPSALQATLRMIVCGPPVSVTLQRKCLQSHPNGTAVIMVGNKT